LCSGFLASASKKNVWLAKIVTKFGEKKLAEKNGIIAATLKASFYLREDDGKNKVASFKVFFGIEKKLFPLKY
jgi:hypothetical protein